LKADSISTTTNGIATVTNVFPNTNNVTRVDFHWTIPNQDLVDIFPLPIYRLSFRARYAGSDPLFLNNVSSCVKNIDVRICGGPMFEAPQSLTSAAGNSFYALLASPAWASFSAAASPACGLAADKPCLTPAHVTTINGLSARVAMLQATPPTPQDLSAAISSGVAAPATVGVRVGQPVQIVVAARAVDPARADRLMLEVIYLHACVHAYVL
jgi:hypothetical protein